jgi:enamine deaminase RidA (YjgF/YER057c/UK114 family)
MRQRIESNPASLWPQCSKGVQVGQSIYLSGQVGSDDDGTLAGDDIRSQAKKSLENIERLLTVAGATRRDIVHLTLYFTDPANADGYFEVAAEFFPEDPPAATAVVVAALLSPRLLIEIQATAIKSA